MKQILIILASCGLSGNGEPPDGKWLEELTVPYRRFREAGYAVFISAPCANAQGGARILEAMKKNAPDGLDPGLEHLFLLEEVTHWHFDALYYPGKYVPECACVGGAGHIELLSRMFDAGKVIGAVSHGPASLLGCVRCDGQPLVFRHSVTGLSKAEEAELVGDPAAGFRLEDRLREAGALYISKGPWETCVVADGNLITGQNPNSAGNVAETMIRQLEHE